jgi:hypothetical protein
MVLPIFDNYLSTNRQNILKVVENNTKQPGLDCLSFFLDFVSAMPRKVNARTR